MLAPQHAFYAACLSFVWFAQKGKSKKRKVTQSTESKSKSGKIKDLYTVDKKYKDVNQKITNEPVNEGSKFNSEILFTSRANLFCEQDVKVWK